MACVTVWKVVRCFGLTLVLVMDIYTSSRGIFLNGTCLVIFWLTMAQHTVHNHCAVYNPVMQRVPLTTYAILWSWEEGSTREVMILAPRLLCVANP